MNCFYLIGVTESVGWKIKILEFHFYCVTAKNLNKNLCWTPFIHIQIKFFLSLASSNDQCFTNWPNLLVKHGTSIHRKLDKRLHVSLQLHFNTESFIFIYFKNYRNMVDEVPFQYVLVYQGIHQPWSHWSLMEHLRVHQASLLNVFDKLTLLLSDERSFRNSNTPNSADDFIFTLH